ncbi:hypothetical protein RIVM261_075580 [Rivularia sp. IAM M-261]|nr:hypothetical protein RIVM261_075580 [Rivularia sp. IAM M-261]
MWDILLNGQYNAKNIILNIQERYKFYNHDIFHCPSVEETSKTNPPNCPNNNIFYGDVGAVNTGTVNNQGNQIGIQYNQQSE